MKAKIYLHIHTTLLLLSFCNLTTKSTNVENAYFNLAEAFKNEKNINEAITYYQKALERNPQHLTTLFSIGHLYLNQNDYDIAIEYFKRRLAIQPKCEKTEWGIGKAYDKKKELKVAIEHYQKAIKINPKFMGAYKDLIEALKKNKNINLALEICKKALKYNPLDITIRNKFIDLLKNQKKFEEAIEQCNQLIKIAPNNQNKIKKAHTLSLCNKEDKAIEIFKEILKEHPNNTKIIYNIALLNKKKGEYEKAIALYKKILESEPNNRKSNLGISQAYLALGDFKNGWKTLSKYYYNKQAKSRLTSTNDINNNTILIQGEWYSDDMIQLIRYAKIIKEMGAKSVIIQSPNNLIPLFKNLPYVDKVVNMNKGEACTFNKHIPISCIPHLFETTEKTIPRQIPYIKAPQELVDFWQKKLLHDPNFKIGIYISKTSNIPAHKLLQLSNIETINAYILSNQSNTEYLKELPTSTIIQSFGKGFIEHPEDILNLSALLQNLDLIITCDSYVAHLAGAMGVPVWIIVPNIANYRWMKEKTDSPWYPTMRIFRQDSQETWQPTIDKIYKCLQELLG